MPTRREVLEHDLPKKLALEDKLRPEIRRLFNRIGREFRTSIALTGSPRPVSRYQTELVDILGKHYRRVYRSFKETIAWQNAEEQRKQIEEQRGVDKELALLLFMGWADAQATQQADIILSTTAAEMDAALELARQSLAEEGELAPSPLTLAAAAAAFLSRFLDARTGTIVITETQSSAETTKTAEVSALTRVAMPGLAAPSEAMPGLTPKVTPLTARKTWITVRDTLVRPTHRAAEGQTVVLNDPFIVGGARLMYPSDTSLGAPIKEVINCRCSALYKVEPV